MYSERNVPEILLKREDDPPNVYFTKKGYLTRSPQPFFVVLFLLRRDL